MKKRYWGLALCAALCVGMLSGCSWNSGTVSGGAGAIAEKKEQDSSAEKTEKTEKPEDSTEPETEEVTQAETEAETEISAAPELGRFTRIAPKPMGSSSDGSISLTMAR